MNPRQGYRHILILIISLLLVAIHPAAAQDVGFVPQLTKLGFVEIAEDGRTEQLVWFITVHNMGDVAGTNLVVTDTVRDELRIDSVDVPEGSSYSIDRQTVQVTIPTLAAGDMVIIEIRTTVIRRAANNHLDNIACLIADGLVSERCTIAPTIRAMPATGESSRSRSLPLVMFALFIVGSILATWGVGLVIRRRDRAVFS